MPKILLVEDNQMNWEMLSLRLNRKGYDVKIATDGLQGIDIAQKEIPDLILMDMDLPKLDGWEATKRLKTIPLTKNIPVIALTAHVVNGDRKRAIEAGCAEYEPKPINFKSLIAKIQQYLNQVDD